MLFSQLKPGDLIFLRGDAKLLDVVEITSDPYYDYEHGQDGDYDYCTTAAFRRLTDRPTTCSTKTIPYPYYYNVLREGVVRLAMRRIGQTDGEWLFNLLIAKIRQVGSDRRQSKTINQSVDGGIRNVSPKSTPTHRPPTRSSSSTATPAPKPEAF